MITVLTGATGFIGTRLIRLLQRDDRQVRIVTRQPRPRCYSWDSIADAVDGAAAVIHLAGEPVAQRWTPDVKRRIRESRLDGTRRVVEALRTARNRPRVLVSASAIGYYGSRGDEVLTEASGAGSGFLPEVCQAWEGMALEAESFSVRVVLPRIGIVLGREGGMLKKVLPPFRAGLGGRLGSGEQWMSWIHVDDLVDLILFALREQVQGPVNAVAPEPVKNTVFTQTLAAALHRPALMPVPGFALRLAFGEMGEVMVSSQRVKPAVVRTAGFAFRFPTLAQALDDLLVQGSR